MTSVADYVEAAVARVREVMEAELAVVHAELEARIAEAYFEGSSGNIDPHHITTALRLLRDAGEITDHRNPAKGGSDLDTIEVADRRRRATAIDRAAATKRGLYARYHGWAKASVRHPHGRLGPAGETATRLAVLASGKLLPATPAAGDVSNILGVELRGPADSGGYMLPLSQGIPGNPVTVLIEVKNIRSWIYPSSAELYQLLEKALALQEARPANAVVPVLVCRRAHRTLFTMAKQFGFFVIATSRQWAGEVTDEELLPIRNGLHFHDLHRGSDPSVVVTKRFRETLPEQCTASAAAWAFTCRYPAVTGPLRQLRDASNSTERSRLLEGLRHVTERLDFLGGW